MDNLGYSLPSFIFKYPPSHRLSLIHSSLLVLPSLFSPEPGFSLWLTAKCLKEIMHTQELICYIQSKCIVSHYSIFTQEGTHYSFLANTTPIKLGVLWFFWGRQISSETGADEKWQICVAYKSSKCYPWIPTALWVKWVCIVTRGCEGSDEVPGRWSPIWMELPTLKH